MSSPAPACQHGDCSPWLATGEVKEVATSCLLIEAVRASVVLRGASATCPQPRDLIPQASTRRRAGMLERRGAHSRYAAITVSLKKKKQTPINTADSQAGKLQVPRANEDPGSLVSHGVPHSLRRSQPRLINLQRR